MIVRWSRYHYPHLSTLLQNVRIYCFDLKVHLPGPETCSQLLESVTDAMLRFCWSSAVQQNAPRANFKCIFQTSRVNVQLTTNHSNGPMLDMLAGTLINLLIKSFNVCTDLSIMLNPLTQSINFYFVSGNVKCAGCCNFDIDGNVGNNFDNNNDINIDKKTWQYS